MTGVVPGIALAMAVGAALLCPLAPARFVARLTTAHAAPVARRAPRRWVRFGPVALLAATVAWLVAGRAAGVAVVLVAMVGATVAWIVDRRRREQRAHRAQAGIAHACAALAAELRAGRPPEAAVAVVAADFPELAPGAAALATGQDPTSIWRRDGAGPGSQGLVELARAWQVSQATGSPLGPTLDRISHALDAETSVAATVLAELAPARATGQVMAALPFVGLFIAHAIGAQPLAFLFTSTPGVACVLLGTGLACAGTVWTEWLARPPHRRT